MPRPGNSSSRVMPRISPYQCFAASRSRTLMATWRKPLMGIDGFVSAVMGPPGLVTVGCGTILVQGNSPDPDAYVRRERGECQYLGVGETEYGRGPHPTFSICDGDGAQP